VLCVNSFTGHWELELYGHPVSGRDLCGVQLASHW